MLAHVSDRLLCCDGGGGGVSQDGYILPGLGDAGDREFQTGTQGEKIEILTKKQKL